MADMLILPTLERLQPYGERALGLVFASALEGGLLYPADSADPFQAWMKAFLRPWSWADGGATFLPVKRIQIYYLQGGSWSALGEAPVSRQIPDKALCPGGLEALTDRLDDRFRCFGEQGGNPWRWSPDAGRVDRNVRPWPAFLGDVALHPWPLPQALGLSSFCDLGGLYDALPQDATALVAAPILELGTGGGGQTLIPVPPVASRFRGELVDLAYGNPVPGLGITAVARPMKLQDVKPGTFIDLTSLWVQKTDQNVTSEDWRSDLETRIATELDLARLTIDWLRSQLQTDRKSLEKSYPDLAWDALERLQKATTPLLGAGLLQGDLLRRAAARRRDEQGKSFSEATIEALFNLAKPWFDAVSSQTWQGWVSDVMAGREEAPRILNVALKAEDKARLGRFSIEEVVAQLDGLAVALTSPETAAEMFRKSWADFLESKKDAGLSEPVKSLAKALTEKAPNGEPEVGIEVLRARVGEIWRIRLSGVLGQGKTMEQCREALVTEVSAKLQELRFPAAWSDARAKEIAARVFLKDTDAARRNVRGTRGITVEVDTLAADRGEADLLQEIQGTALLMRKAKAAEWHCLNLAAAKIGEKVIADRVLLPSRLAYVEGLSAPTLTYDNQPLTVPGPLAQDTVAGTSVEPGEKAAQCSLDDPLLDFSYSKSAPIPELVFNRDYEIVPFVVTNAGAIPEALVDPGAKPWRLKSKIETLAPEAGIRSYAYKREAHVGALRFGSREGLPEIPARVAPRIRELPQETVLPKGDPLFRETKELRTDSVLAGTPLLLLAPSGFKARTDVVLRDRFAFEILPPTIDLQTWDRWVAGSTLDKSWRRFVWNTYYKLAHEKGGDEDAKSLEAAGVYLTDPSVEGFWAELVAFDDDQGKPVVYEPIKMDFKESDPAGPVEWKGEPVTLKKFQRSGLKVSLGFSKEGSLVVTVNEKSFDSPFHMFRLSVYARLNPDGMKRFRWPENLRPETQPGITSPWHLLIEIPRRLDPKDRKGLQTALFNALIPQKGQVEVGLNLKDLSGLRGHMHRAELWHQVWHWRGRPPADHADLSSAEKAVAFEMFEFGERRDDEHRRLPMRRLPDQLAPTDPAFVYQESPADQGPQGDLRALYHRFSARVFSRYEGLLGEEDGSLEAINDADENRWKHLFVPCRHTGDVPVPKVRLVLPLTQGPDREKDGPGLLVVVDGPWYEVGGLGEKLDAEVMTVSGPEVEEGKEDLRYQYYQAGTDPILTDRSAGADFNKPGALGLSRFNVEFAPPEGAIGHHREATDADPRFQASSFLLSRPAVSVKGDDGVVRSEKRDISWWFLRLRFRRGLETAGGKLWSEWSAPFWVQLLPGVERVEDEWFKNAEPAITLKNKKVLTVSPPAREMSNDRKSLQIFGVMTRKVFDVSGRPDQEAYISVWWRNGASWQTDPGLEIGSTQDLYMRWIEVQSVAPLTITRSEDFWSKNLFDPSTLDSERARIVRISKPFCVKEAS